MLELRCELPDFLHWQDGEVRLVGHRIGLYHVVREYDCGEQAEAIALHFPTLPLGLVFKVLAFYVDNQTAVSAYMVQYDRSLEEQRARYPQRVTMEMLRERLGAVMSKALRGGGIPRDDLLDQSRRERTRHHVEALVRHRGWRVCDRRRAVLALHALAARVKQLSEHPAAVRPAGLAGSICSYASIGAPPIFARRRARPHGDHHPQQENRGDDPPDRPANGGRAE